MKKENKYPNRFSNKIAREIAEKQFDQTLDCMRGVTDPDYGLDDELYEFEQNFEEDLQERGVNTTPARVEKIKEIYGKMAEKARAKLDKVYKSLYSKEAQKKF